MNEKRPLVISGFPGIGKSWLYEHPGSLVIADSDSGTFSWSYVDDQRIRHPEWPDNYMQHIGEMRNADIVLVSTHEEVRKALVAAKTPFFLVYPGFGMKEEFIARYVVRNSPDKFVQLLRENYDAWISDLQGQEGCTRIVLQPGQYLADVLPRILQA